MGQGFDGFARGWDAGAAASPLGNLGDAARTRIRANLATSAAPGYALAINDFLGPAQTTMDAAIGAAFSAIPVGGAGGKVLSKADDAARFAGVRELSAALRTSGVERAARVERIQAFNVESIVGRTASAEDAFTRYWGGAAPEFGRWLSPAGRAQGRGVLALPASNTAEHLTEFKVKSGTRYFEGDVAPNKWGPGGGRQALLLDVDVLRLEKRWR